MIALVCQLLRDVSGKRVRRKDSARSLPAVLTYSDWLCRTVQSALDSCLQAKNAGLQENPVLGLCQACARLSVCLYLFSWIYRRKHALTSYWWNGDQQNDPVFTLKTKTTVHVTCFGMFSALKFEMNSVFILTYKLSQLFQTVFFF